MDSPFKMPQPPLQTPTTPMFAHQKKTPSTHDNATTAPYQATTPVGKRTQADSEVEYTPLNPKSSSTGGGGGGAEFQHENVKYALSAGIANDVSKFQKCRAEVMLKTILGFVTEKGKQLSMDTVLEEVLPIANDAGICEQLRQYCEANKEEDLYWPFITTMNRALGKLGKIKIDGLKSMPDEDRRILLQRNDPNIMKRRHSLASGVDLKFKPDVEIITFDTAKSALQLEDLNDLKWDQIAKSPDRSGSSLPAGSPGISWEQNLSSFEFKHVNRARSSVPAGYISQPLVVVPNEKRFLAPSHDGLEHDDRTTGTTPVPSSTLYDSTGVDSSKDRRLGREPRRKRGREGASSGTSGEKGQKRVKTQTSPEVLQKMRASERPPLDKPTQAGFYGAERLCHSVGCTHTIVLVIENEIVWVWWFDRQGAIQAEGFDLVKNFPYFLVLLLAFQRFEPRHWGLYPEFKGGTGYELTVQVKQAFGTFNGSQQKATGDDRKTYACIIDEQRQNEIHARFSLTGRATRTSHCMVKNDDHSGQKKLVSKFSWPETTRAREADIIFEAHQKLLSNPDPEIRGLTKHLPDVFFTFDDPETCTSNIRNALEIENAEDGARTLRGIICGKLEPITNYATLPVDRSSGKILWKLFWECFTVHFVLWAFGVQHGDISPNNLMYRQDPGEEPCGVLNDYDLAHLEGLSSRNWDRTGTIPFLALSLLTKDGLAGKVAHLYSHDAESFVWVLIWILHRYRDNKGEIERNKGPCRLWLSRHFKHVKGAKAIFHDDVKEERIDGADSPYHYRAESLGKYFANEENTEDFVGQPMSFIVNEIHRILIKQPRKFSKDSAFVEYQRGPSGLKPVGHRNTDPLQLPFELLSAVQKVGGVIIGPG